MPHLQELYNTWSPKGLHFLAITNENQAAIEKFATDKNITYPLGIGNIAPLYGVNGIPHAYLLVDGKIAWEGHPSANDWQNDLEENLKKYPGKKQGKTDLADVKKTISDAKNHGRGKDPLGAWECWNALNGVLESGVYDKDGKDYAKLAEDVAEARAKAETLPEGEALLNQYKEAHTRAMELAGPDPKGYKGLSDEVKGQIRELLQPVIDAAPKSMHGKAAKELLKELGVK